MNLEEAIEKASKASDYPTIQASLLEVCKLWAYHSDTRNKEAVILLEASINSLIAKSKQLQKLETVL